MAVTAERVVIDVLARFEQAERNAARFRSRFDTNMRGIQGSAARTELAVTRGMRNLAGAIGLVSTIALARGLLSIADQAKNLDAQLRLATSQTGSFGRATEDVRRIAESTRSSLGATADLYGSFQRNAQELGITQMQAARATETLTKTLTISGAGAGESAAAIRQFSQALASGVLRGDEFNSIMENAPRLARLLADSLGVPVGALRKMAEEGQLTADKLTRALTDQRFTDGKHPDMRTIYASFSERLGVRANAKLQRAFDSYRFRAAFPALRLNEATGGRSIASQRNNEILEFVDQRGYFRNTTVRGSITGESLDLGVLDDPIKSREEANSQTIRDKTWDWFNDDFRTRFSDEAGLLCILTRWHVDDPAGRLLAADSDVKVLSYSAIADADEEHRKAGEALFPELKSLSFLMEQKRTMDPISWEALYQQKPIVAGGNLFKIDEFRRHKLGQKLELKHRCIYADTAQKTGEANDYSVFQVWGLGKDGVAYLIDQVRKKMEAPELERTARQLWARHSAVASAEMGKLTAMKVEDKVSGTGLIQQLNRPGPDRVTVLPIKRGTTDKYTRATDALPSIAAGRVSVPEDAPWSKDLFAELAAFPAGKHDDQVDPLVDAVADLLLSGAWASRYNIEALT